MRLSMPRPNRASCAAMAGTTLLLAGCAPTSLVTPLMTSMAGSMAGMPGVMGGSQHACVGSGAGAFPGTGPQVGTAVGSDAQMGLGLAQAALGAAPLLGMGGLSGMGGFNVGTVGGLMQAGAQAAQLRTAAGCR